MRIFVQNIIFYLLFFLFLASHLQAQTDGEDSRILVSLDSVSTPTVFLGEVMIKSARDRRPLQELPISTSLVPSTQVEQE